MDVIELNGGRFYLRPLHDDNRIDDRPALAQITDNPQEILTRARSSAKDYYWAICEQTRVDMVALAHFDGTIITTTPIGDPDRVLPNDPVLPAMTVQDAADLGREVVARYIDSHNHSI
ncbi:hypothetical protein N7326_02870 [Corynebacterium sp. ES2794-CONJ1]|uniref:hypothetical protein n=1 Tax=unclassified Corynebacterium TaxID=2624378 RepID=UPI002166C26D|nr:MULTISPECIES: hypothetical protein [unclassified Corynebacterium]MCS4489518.1 hypothetical protein [Corynebacterium sp. ES2775-CONJ]MCS4491471.1 hypothetical protein [Corynebacterium sp. ES2715-CONJ3]MCU9518816.1 hypothetical protein [Corynebacterium sp. ES2794-CONJ1]